MRRLLQSRLIRVVGHDDVLVVAAGVSGRWRASRAVGPGPVPQPPAQHLSAGPPQQEVEEEVGAGADHHHGVRGGRHPDVRAWLEQLDSRQPHEEEKARHEHAGGVPAAQPQHQGRQLLLRRGVFPLGPNGPAAKAAEEHGEDDVDGNDGGVREEVEEDEGHVQGVDEPEGRQLAVFDAVVADAIAADEIEDEGQGEEDAQRQDDAGPLQGQPRREAAVSQEGAGDGETPLPADVQRGVGGSPQRQGPDGEEDLGDRAVPQVHQSQSRQRQAGQQEEGVVQSQASQLHGARRPQTPAEAHQDRHHRPCHAGRAERDLQPEEDAEVGLEVVLQLHAQTEVLHDRVHEHPIEVRLRVLNLSVHDCLLAWCS